MRDGNHELAVAGDCVGRRSMRRTNFTADIRSSSPTDAVALTNPRSSVTRGVGGPDAALDAAARDDAGVGAPEGRA